MNYYFVGEFFSKCLVLGCGAGVELHVLSVPYHIQTLFPHHKSVVHTVKIFEYEHMNSFVGLVNGDSKLLLSLSSIFEVACVVWLCVVLYGRRSWAQDLMGSS